MSLHSVVEFDSSSLLSGIDCCIGTIVEINDMGQVTVDYPANIVGPVLSRVATNLSSVNERGGKLQIPVVIIFEDGDPMLPIIIGVIRDKVLPAKLNEGGEVPVERPKEGGIDGKTIVFNAEDKIALNCGKSSITLQKNGKVIIKGTQVTSRSSGSQKIKGSVISIN